MKRIEKRIIQLALLIVFMSGQALAKDPGINAFYQGDYKKAADYYDARLKKDKENEKIMFNSGTSALAQQDLEKANSLLMQSLATDDESQLAKAHYNLGQLALQQENGEEALAHFMKSMIYDPDDPNAKIMYEHILHQQQDQQEQQQNQDQENKDQEQDQQDKQDKQDQQQQEDEQKQDPREEDTPPEQEKPEEEQQQQQQESQLSEEDLEAQELTKEQAKNILNAMKEDEKESMKKLILSKAKGKKVKRSKEW